MPEHENRHRSQSHAQPRHVAQQIGTKKLLRPKPCAQKRDESESHADQPRTLLDGLDHWRRHQVQIMRGNRAHFVSSCVLFTCGTGSVAPEPGSSNFGGCDGTVWPAGTSAGVAPWLNCRARM